MTLLVNLSFAPSQPTGWLNYSLNLLPQLKDIDTHIISPLQIPGMKCYPSPANITTDFGIKGHFRRLFWLQWQLPQLYLRMQSQLLFSPIPEAPLFSGCRYVITIHDLIPLRLKKIFSTAQKVYCRYYIPAVINSAQHIICNSQTTAEDLYNFLEVPEHKITVIPLAYDHWFVGATDKRYTPILQKQIQELGLTQQAKFLNYIHYKDLPQIINQALALVFPSLWEGFGFPVLEAMACGTPVITSNVSSLPEVAGDAAILIDPYKISAITEAMKVILANTQLRNSLSLAGISRASQFSWEKTGKATMEVLLYHL